MGFEPWTFLDGYANQTNFNLSNVIWLLTIEIKASLER